MPERDGDGPVTVGFVLGKGPSWRLTVDGDRVGEVREGPVAEGDTDLLFTLAPEDAPALADGSLTLDEAFMRGRTKMVGSIGTFMAVLPVLAGDGWRDACRDLLAPATA